MSPNNLHEVGWMMKRWKKKLSTNIWKNPSAKWSEYHPGPHPVPFQGFACTRCTRTIRICILSCFFSHLPSELHWAGSWQALPTAQNMGRTLSFASCLQTPGYRVWRCHCSRHERQTNQLRGFDVTLTQIGGSEQAGKISQHSANVQPT